MQAGWPSACCPSICRSDRLSVASPDGHFFLLPCIAEKTLPPTLFFSFSFFYSFRPTELCELVSLDVRSPFFTSRQFSAPRSHHRSIQTHTHKHCCCCSKHILIVYCSPPQHILSQVLFFIFSHDNAKEWLCQTSDAIRCLHFIPAGKLYLLFKHTPSLMARSTKDQEAVITERSRFH